MTTADLARIQDDRLPEVNGNGLVYVGPTPGSGGTQAIYQFPNGYGASIVRYRGSYGNRKGLWELAVLRITEGDMWKWPMEYSTPITDDVIGWLSPPEVDEILEKITALPPREITAA